jgi:5-methyltetrahydropteroyltriglutamate--homocysteine methyltransferase
MSMTIQTMLPGYARIGKRREVKKALKSVWNGISDTDTMLQTVRDIEAYDWKTFAPQLREESHGK